MIEGEEMEKPNRRRFTLAQAHQIRRAYNVHGKLMREIAAEYGTTTTTISDIVNGKTYRDYTWLKPPAKVWQR